MTSELRLSCHAAQGRVLRTLISENNSRAVVTAGRRFGKTALQLVVGLYAALSRANSFDARFRPTVLLANPTLVQARQVLWRPLLRLLNTSGINYTPNASEHTVDLGASYPLIKIVGTNDRGGDGCRGLKICHFGADEAQDMILPALEESIWPALLDTVGATELYTGTPKGKLNVLYHLSQQVDEGCFFNYPSWANTTIPGLRERAEAAKKIMPLRAWRQEFLGSFEDAEGLFYGEYCSTANRYTELPSQDYVTWIGYDPGAVNAGLVVIYEGRDDGVFYVGDWRTLGDGVNALIPDDVRRIIKNVALQGPLKSIMIDPSRPDEVALLRHLGGIKGVNEFSYGINTVNSLFKQRRIKIHSSLTEADHQISSYVRERDRRTGLYLEEKEGTGVPTHALDGLRYVLATLNRKRRNSFTVLP